MEIEREDVPGKEFVAHSAIEHAVGQVNLGGGFTVPAIDTKNVTTEISVNNGDTAVIGGPWTGKLL